MRAISVFIFDTGMSTRRCFDPHALRIRVSISAIGSVMLITESGLLSYPSWTWRNEVKKVVTGFPVPRLPRRFAYSRNHSLQRQLAKTDSAHAEPAQIR